MRAVETNHQNVCPKCEEMVHKYAARCPYCMQDLSLPLVKLQEHSLSLPPNDANLLTQDKLPGPSKITEMPFQNIAQDTHSVSPLHHLQSLDGDAGESTIDDESNVSHTMLATLLPLITLLAGTFFFFFGLLIKVFSKNGVLVLQWPAGNWPYFVFPSLILIIAGMVMLSFIEGFSQKS